ncbi:hypothetical protein C4561_01235 [candidate division WWE3 bacterium]|jgi:hypothetical protein|uniref:Uncharacterized protein n=1 Tax=candidate division WWE3 bacterium TaxID=2053526 RepID=A0A3A4ZFS8_UNCKA|nr:MAG: hypothetical protein C4561_01235 [candidate division WWE3 bacterium]
MIKKFSTPFLAFLQATGLVIYIGLISAFFTYAGQSLEHKVPQFFAPIIMLLLFIISAVLSASLVLGRAAVLFWDKKYKEAFSLVFWTVGWGIFYFLGIICYLSLY